MTDRPISGREAASGNRSLDYDTSVLIMEFPAGDKDADGAGTLHLALELEYDDKDGKLHVETLGLNSRQIARNLQLLITLSSQFLIQFVPNFPNFVNFS